MSTLFSGITEGFTDLDNPKLDNIGYGCLLLSSIQFFNFLYFPGCLKR